MLGAMFQHVNWLLAQAGSDIPLGLGAGAVGGVGVGGMVAWAIRYAVNKFAATQVTITKLHEDAETGRIEAIQGLTDSLERAAKEVYALALQNRETTAEFQRVALSIAEANRDAAHNLRELQRESRETILRVRDMMNFFGVGEGDTKSASPRSTGPAKHEVRKE